MDQPQPRSRLADEIRAEENLRSHLRQLLRDCRNPKIILNKLGRYPGSMDLIPMYEKYAIECVNARAQQEAQSDPSPTEYAVRLDLIKADVLDEVEVRWPRDIQATFDAAGMVNYGDSKSGFFQPGNLARVRMGEIKSAVRARVRTLKAEYGDRLSASRTPEIAGVSGTSIPAMIEPRATRDPRAMVEVFLARCGEVATFRLYKKYIWMLAGHKTARQFQHWQASDERSTRSDDQNFRRILSMEPGAFIAELKKRRIAPGTI